MTSTTARRPLAPWLVAVAAAAACLLGMPGTAQASLGGAPPATTNFRPDLRTIHVLTGINAGRAQFCFDKPISIAAASGDSFRLGGYRWDTILTGLTRTTPVLDSTGSCAIVQMTGARDLNSYSFGSVLAGVATANVSGGQPNLADSAPNLDSTSHSGTAGHTAGPDLVGVTVGAPAGNNEIVYSFDQPVDPAHLQPGGFGYYDAAGTVHAGTVVTGVDNTGDVRVAFGTTTVSSAVLAFAGQIFNGANPTAQDNAPAPSTLAPLESVAVPGTGGVTASPDLASAALVPGAPNQIDYTFDKNVVFGLGGSAASAVDFVAAASNGDQVAGSSATILADGKTVRVTFNAFLGTQNIGAFLEEITVASVFPGAVLDSNNATLGNTAAGKAVGGNPGAFATGFTNAPDATGVTFDKSSGQAVVTFDQRIAANAAGQPVAQDGTTPTPLANWVLLDANGNPLATPTSATVESTGPYTSQVRLTFTSPPLLSVAKSLMVVGNQNSSNPANTTPFVTFGGTPASAVFTFGNPHGPGLPGMNPAGNVQQILAPTATGTAYLDPARGHVRVAWRWVHIVRKANGHRGLHHRRR